jgi:hypothetical protein
MTPAPIKRREIFGQRRGDGGVPSGPAADVLLVGSEVMMLSIG